MGPLHVYAPSKEFILALKILAGRDQDLAELDVLFGSEKEREP